MAYYIRNKKTVFIHISKAGGTSVRDWLKENLTTEKVAQKHCKIDTVKQKNLEFDLHFTVIRNPFARVHSWYWYHAQGLTNNNINNKQAHWKVAVENGFNWWIKNNTRNGSIKESIWWTQKSFIDTNLPHIICKLENINKDFKKIQEYLDCFESLPLKNTSNHNHYRQDFTLETQKIIEEHFKEDLEYFNYDF
jgi:hypothetical protein